MQSNLKIIATYRDGTPDLITDMPVEHQTQSEVALAKAKLFSLYSGFGGIVIDQADGSTILYPYSLFSRVKIEIQSVMLASVIQ